MIKYVNESNGDEARNEHSQGENFYRYDYMKYRELTTAYINSYNTSFSTAINCILCTWFLNLKPHFDMVFYIWSNF